jgi:hypothetical protein
VAGRHPPRTARSGAPGLMVEVLGIVVAAACFLAAFGLIVFLDRV